jgi:Ca2+-transporting ATPase
LIIDPACSIVLEAEPAEPTVMKRPPRNSKEPLFGRKTVGLAMLQGGGILVIILAIYATSLYLGEGELNARALTFTALILANLGLILSASSTSPLSFKILRTSNAALWWVMGGGLFFMAIVLYFPFLRNLFSFSFLHPIDFAICLLGGGISLVWFEQLKLLNRPQGVSERT